MHAGLHVKLRLLGKSRVWGRGYTTIPLAVRRVLAVKNGDILEWYITGQGEVIVRKREVS